MEERTKTSIFKDVPVGQSFFFRDCKFHKNSETTAEFSGKVLYFDSYLYVEEILQ